MRKPKREPKPKWITEMRKQNPLPEQPKWIIKDKWSQRDDNTAWTQGWYVSRQTNKGGVTIIGSKKPPTIVFVSPKGEANFNRGIKENRRLACRALLAVVSETLG